MFFQRLWRAHALGVLAVVIVVGAVYAQTLGFGFVWDDDQIIYGRIEYQSPSRASTSATLCADMSNCMSRCSKGANTNRAAKVHKNEYAR